MIKVENLSYSFPEKDLYKEVSFTIEDGQHVVLIGSNGTGKTTLIDMLLNDEKYLYDGKIIRELEGRVGYVSQYEKEEKDRDITVFEFLSEEFVKNQVKNAKLCEEMAVAEDLEVIYEEYQNMGDDDKKEVRFAMKHWLLSQDGSTIKEKADDGEDFTEEIQLKNLNKHLPDDKQLTQQDLDYIRYFLTDENMVMSAYEYLPYAWNKGTEDKPDRVMADQIGLILSDPEIYDYDQHTANVVAIAKKYAEQATGADGYWELNDTLDSFKKAHWYN